MGDGAGLWMRRRGQGTLQISRQRLPVCWAWCASSATLPPGTLLSATPPTPDLPRYCKPPAAMPYPGLPMPYPGLPRRGVPVGRCMEPAQTIDMFLQLSDVL